MVLIIVIVIGSWLLLCRAHYANEHAARMQFVHSIKAILSLLERVRSHSISIIATRRLLMLILLYYRIDTI
jgi:hypothetical protein